MNVSESAGGWADLQDVLAGRSERGRGRGRSSGHRGQAEAGASLLSSSGSDQNIIKIQEIKIQETPRTADETMEQKY